MAKKIEKKEEPNMAEMKKVATKGKKKTMKTSNGYMKC